MFNLNQLTISSRRIGLGIAVAALTVTSLLTPLSASAHQNMVETVQKAPGGPIENPPPGDPYPSPFQADLKVVGRGKVQVGNTTQYSFAVTNLGPAAANNFNVFKEAHLKTIVGNSYLVQSGGTSTMSLASGQTKSVIVTCAPPAGYQCTHANVVAWQTSGNDPDTNNNLGTIY